MARSVDPSTTFFFVLKADRDLPEEQQTVFELAVLTVGEYAKIEDSSLVGDRETVFKARSGSTVLEVLRIGLRGWKNMRDKDGNEIVFQTHTVAGGSKGKVQQPTDATLSRIAPQDRKELCNAITEGNTLREEDRGN